MVKNKLIEARKSRGITQKQLAEELAMDISNYNRRERGEITISNDEWLKLADILEVPVESIYQVEEGQLLVIRDNKDCSHFAQTIFYSIPEYILESQKRYIEKLEEENKKLREQLEK